MKAKTAFDAAITRGEHLLTLYDLLGDQRKRSVREDWASKFRKFMKWKQNEKIIRVDGDGCIVILRESANISREHFKHDYLSELLRFSLVAAVSAMDRYFHDAVVERSWSLLGRKEENIPKELLKLEIPVLEAKRALSRLKGDNRSRPGNLVKKAIQDKLHAKFTFQNPDNVLKAARMLGVEDFWSKVATNMPGVPKGNNLQNRLKQITLRRNQIVHEADLERKTRQTRLSLREVSSRESKKSVKWIKEFVQAVDKVFDIAIRTKERDTKMSRNIEAPSTTSLTSNRVILPFAASKISVNGQNRKFPGDGTPLEPVREAV